MSRSHATVHRVLVRGGCSRRPKPPAPEVVHYEWPCPGNLLHMDVKKFGKVERFQQTLGREWAYAMEYASRAARRESLPRWIDHYNERRTHSALGDRPPMDRVREVLGFDS
ncbi:MAG: integrase core domain-containing protein [Solirubrobacterales bacterium]